MIVGLGMFNKGYEVLDTESCQEVFRSLIFELGVVVSDNGVWEAIPSCEVFSGELLHLVVSYFLQWSCLDPCGPCGEVVNND